MEVQALKITCGSAFHKTFFKCLDVRVGGKKGEEERRNELIAGADRDGDSEPDPYWTFTLTRSI